MYDFENKVVVVTGGAQGIGKCICEEFEKQGAKVCIIDLKEDSYFQGDVAEKKTLEQFVEKVIAHQTKKEVQTTWSYPKQKRLLKT